MSDVIIIGLATYTMVMLIVYKDGPFDIFAKIRFFAGVNVPIVDVVTKTVVGHECNGSLTSKLISCHTCTSFWAGFIVFLFSVSPVSIILNPIAAIGLSIFMFEVTYGD